MNLYERIKELAKSKNISIRQLEENLGLANATIRRWGTQNPGADKLTKVADFFHVSVDYLLGKEDVPRVEINKPKVQILARQMDTQLTDEEIDMLGALVSKFAKDKFGDE